MIQETTQREKGIWANFGLFLCVLLTAGTAIAAACQLSKPWDAPVTDTYRIREKHPVSGAPNRPHRGVDLNKPGSSDCGEVVTLRDGCTFEKYTNYGGYGNTLIRDCGNGVKELYGHLEAYDKPPGTYKVGTTGGSTGCHLHYEVIIDGVTVDPECVWGTGKNCPSQGNTGSSQANLCDAAQREALKKNAQDKLGSLANSTVIDGGTAKDGKNPTTSDKPGGGDGTQQNPGITETDTDLDIDTYSPNDPGYDPDIGGEKRDDPPTEEVPKEDYTSTVPDPPAGGGKVTSCAPDTWTAMMNQAIMQSRRETAINQTYIVKPDSILAYACLDESIKAVQEKAGPIFSESDHWKDLEVDISGRSAENPKTKTIKMQKELGSTSLDMSIATTTATLLAGYTPRNYEHTLLGGTTSIAASGCDIMKKVWEASKCRNFDKNAAVFPTFEQLIGNDPRKFPSNMACTDTGITQQMIDIAQNKGFNRTKFDKAKSYKEYLEPQSCALTIKTGVTVHRREAEGKTSKIVEYPDAVCSNPGCYYEKSGQACK